MLVGLVDRSTQLKEVIYAPQEYREPEPPGLTLEPPKDNVDVLKLSQALKEQAPTPGLLLPETSAVLKTDPGVLKIGPIPPDVQLYYNCKLNAERGLIDDYFFHLDDDAIKAQAEKLLHGDSYDPDDLSSSVFVRGLCEWFSEKDQASVAKSYENLVSEYAQHMKNDSTPTVSQLQTKFSFAGEETTLGQIFKMRDTALALDAVDYGSGTGTGMFLYSAKKGLMKAAAIQYADTLSGQLGTSFKGNLTRLIDNSERFSMQRWKKDEYCAGRLSKGFYDFLTQSSEYSFKLFSDSNLSNVDFTEKKHLFLDRISEYCEPEGLQIYGKALSEAYDAVCAAIS